jgi:transcriptional regulator with XRE-family HTH domain
MSPFSRLLHDLRIQRNIRQADLAAMVGYDQTYISALEVGLKGPPTREFVDRLAAALILCPDDEAELYAAADASQRKLVIDSDVPQEVYVLINRLRTSLPGLTPTQVRVMTEVLNLKPVNEDMWESTRRSSGRRRKREARM